MRRVTLDTIQAYQQAKQNHRQAEINIASAKAQVDVYKKDIENILASEQVASIEELKAKYQSKKQELEAVTAVLNKEVLAANEVLSKLGMQ